MRRRDCTGNELPVLYMYGTTRTVRYAETTSEHALNQVLNRETCRGRQPARYSCTVYLVLTTHRYYPTPATSEPESLASTQDPTICIMVSYQHLASKYYPTSPMNTSHMHDACSACLHDCARNRYTSAVCIYITRILPAPNTCSARAEIQNT